MRLIIICTLALALPTLATAAPVAPPTPVAGWLFDDGAGTTVTDSFGANNGTLVNSDADEWDTTNKMFGDSSLRFDGSNDHVTVADFDYYGASGFTLSFWFRIADSTSNANNFQYMFSHDTIDSAGSLNIWMVEPDISPAGILRAGPRDGSGDASVLTSPLESDSRVDTDSNDDVADGTIFGEWHLFTLVVTEGTGAELFIDGASNDSNGNGDDAFSPDGTIYLGLRYDGTRQFNGWMDEVALWNQPLSQDNIDWLWNSGTGNSLAAPVPEPATLGLLALGGLAMTVSAARRRRCAKA